MLIFAAMVQNEHFFIFVSALYKNEPSHIKGFGLKSPTIALKNVFGVLVLNKYFSLSDGLTEYSESTYKKLLTRK